MYKTTLLVFSTHLSPNSKTHPNEVHLVILQNLLSSSKIIYLCKKFPLLVFHLAAPLNLYSKEKITHHQPTIILSSLTTILFKVFEFFFNWKIVRYLNYFKPFSDRQYDIQKNLQLGFFSFFLSYSWSSALLAAFLLVKCCWAECVKKALNFKHSTFCMFSPPFKLTYDFFSGSSVAATISCRRSSVESICIFP